MSKLHSKLFAGTVFAMDKHNKPNIVTIAFRENDYATAVDFAHGYCLVNFDKDDDYYDHAYNVIEISEYLLAHHDDLIDR